MTSEPVVKLCTNCKHIATRHTGNWEDFLCMAPQNLLGINPVNGSNLYKMKLCKDQRIFSSSEGRCGPEASWFVEKPAYIEVSPSQLPPNKKKTISADDL